MVELFVNIAKKSDFANFELSQTLNCQASICHEWYGIVINLLRVETTIAVEISTISSITNKVE